jgi:N-ethylmaleimide reductase
VSHEDVAGLTPVAPSTVTLPEKLYVGARGLQPAPQPLALDLDGIQEQIRAFADAAHRAVEAGFDGVELHGANGYLIQQFLSSNVNRRTDAYGGTIGGRIRFANEVALAVSAAIGVDRVGLRISPGAGVWDIGEADTAELYSALLASLAPIGLAYLHVVAGTADTVVPTLRKQWGGVLMVNPSGMGSRETDKSWAEAWLRDGADLVSFGRAFVSNPDLVERLHDSLPLTHAELETYYQGGDRGYIDYAAHQR